MHTHLKFSNRLLVLFSILIASILGACTPVPTAEPTATPVPTATHTLALTSMPTMTITTAPIDTSTPTVIPTEAPTATPEAWKNVQFPKDKNGDFDWAKYNTSPLPEAVASKDFTKAIGDLTDACAQAFPSPEKVNINSWGIRKSPVEIAGVPLLTQELLLKVNADTSHTPNSKEPWANNVICGKPFNGDYGKWGRDTRRIWSDAYKNQRWWLGL